jgi:predicted DNA-binding transcriptional regulator YafY
MGSLLIFERLRWFDLQVRNDHFPNASTLAGRFEIAPKTAQRNIVFMQDRLAAPLEYNAARRGYRYTDAGYEIPRLFASQEEILAVLMAQHLLSKNDGGLIAKNLAKFSKKLLADAHCCKLPMADLSESFSAVWHGYAPAPPDIFQSVVTALTDTRILSFSYTSPKTNATTRRMVEPHHLQNYMASWVLIAWCHSQKDWRKFYLSRMQAPELLSRTFSRRPLESWCSLLEDAFGIFQGADPIEVTLQFTPFRARWIREQLWHPSQKISFLSDGSLELSFPVADFREVKMKILQFGADVKVIRPPELENEIRDEIQKMTSLYAPQTIADL